MTQKQLTGAEIVIQALIDHNVEVIFGYPGGAVLPIYDALFKQNSIRHILVRHEQAAVHAAEGYARSTGKVGVVLVTSGPGATNAVTGLTDALMDSVPLICFSGQVPTHLIGTDAFQECDTTGITRPCTKHNYLVRDVNKLSQVIHESFYVATNGRPGPVLIDVPKDVQFGSATYQKPKAKLTHKNYAPKTTPNKDDMRKAAHMLANASSPILYGGGGIINAGDRAVEYLRKFVDLTNIPTTLTLMGLGAYPASNNNFLGMLGMHGTYEANLSMHDCDVMLNIGARFDDRITGRVDAFSPKSKKIHIDIDPSSIDKNIKADLPIIADCGEAIEQLYHIWVEEKLSFNQDKLNKWWQQIEQWRAKKCLDFKQSGSSIKPQYALTRLNEKIQHKDFYITTEVGQHQMWAAQYIGFDQPKRWMTSGGLGTMGYGMPAAMGVQIAHENALVIDVAGEASIQMNIQELSTICQYNLPVKIFILNNEYMGMVRQWQELLHGGRYSHSYSEALPDFVALAEAYHIKGLRAHHADELDNVIDEMLSHDGPVLVDVVVDKEANCFPMIPSGKAHNEMILGTEDDNENAIDDNGKMLV